MGNMINKDLLPLQITYILKQIQTLNEMRLFLYLLIRAQSELHGRSLHLNSMYGELPIISLEIPVSYLYGKSHNTQQELNKALELAKRCVVMKRENTTYFLNIVSNVELYTRQQKRYIRVYIHRELLVFLTNFSHGYREIDLDYCLLMKRQASIIMYIIVAQKQPIRLTYERLLQVLGKDAGNYPHYSNFVQKILLPVRAELDALSPISFEYDVVKELGERYFVIIPRKTGKETKAEDYTYIRLRMSQETAQQLRDFGYNPKELLLIDEQLRQMPIDRVSDFITRAIQKARCYADRDKKGYAYKVIKNWRK